MLAFFGATALAKWQEKEEPGTKKPGFPTKEIGEKIKEFGEGVLGKAIQILPGSEGVEEKFGTEAEEEQIEGTTDQADPIKIIEIQTKEIIEVIKELPEEQVEKIKKQVFKDFCEEVLKEDD